MINVHHLNCGYLQRDGSPRIGCHCLLLEEKGKVTLIDSGIGMQDVLHPEERIGADRIRQFGFQFDLQQTAFHQLERMGINAKDVSDCVCSHLDTDHTGGLADFPHATVHVSAAELKSFDEGHPRYTKSQLAHKPVFKTYDAFNIPWFGFGTTPLELSYSSTVLLVWTPGHTLGHCGVAIQQGNHWIFFTGDAYYLRGELFNDHHPALPISKASAVDEAQWWNSFKQIRYLVTKHADKITVFGYHDPTEFPDVAMQ
jgi:glyoxylase-like metal-dependent hydrolase (beta-lactamase superfamily II)